MSRKHRVVSNVSLVAVLACLLLASPPRAYAETEKKIGIDQVPAAVKATIVRATRGGRVVDIGEIRKGGKVIRYELECMLGGKEVDLIIGPGGKLLRTEPQGGDDEADERQAKPVDVVAGKLSPAAARAVEKAYPKAKIKSIEVEHAGGIKLHKLVMIDGKREMELEVSPRGTLVSTQMDVSMRQLPKDTRKEVRKAAEGGEIVKIEQEVVMAVVEGGKVVKLPRPKTIYEVKFTKDGKRYEAKIAADAGKAKGWRSKFKVDKKALSDTGRNPYFILVPGHRIHLKGGGETVIITVLDETKVVDGVRTRIVEEREFKGDRLAEVSRNYFAIDKKTKDVYYFGEDVDDYDASGKIVGHGGGWLSGVKGASFGLIMPGKVKIGGRYYQEHAPNVAMDRAENVDLKATLKTPFKTFKKCLYIRESSALEAGLSHKWYAPGIGMIGDDELRLVKFETPK